MATKWEAVNADPSIIPQDSSSPFSIQVPPKTDIWRRTNGNVFDAPCIGQRMPLKTFKSLTATVSGAWDTQFDQGGILLALPSTPGGDVRSAQWIKAGIEYFEGQPKLGVVGTDRYSDWSLAPLFEKGQKATFEAVREGDTLWVYALVNGSREPLREVKWVDFDRRDADAEIWVGVYGAKPTPDAGNEGAHLTVDFEGMNIETV
jgi:regulation of enolase protein 1 (concanavalin A-like superfamily)